jgi:hypothetical protein
MENMLLVSRARSLVVLLTGTMAVAALSPGPSRLQQASQRTPLQLFDAMMPVIGHPRCVNCHHGVDPISGRGHGGGRVDISMDTTRQPPRSMQSCNDGGCHDEATVPNLRNTPGVEWHQPNRGQSFFGKSDKQLCALLADFVMFMGQGPARAHIARDTLIGFAFVGTAAGAATNAAPPPMTRRQFVDSFTVWMNQGQASCDAEGTITRDEAVDTDTTWHVGHIDYRLEQTGRRNVTITLSGGEFHSIALAHGSVKLTTTQNLQNAAGLPCTLISRGLTLYDGSTSGLAQVTIKDTVIFTSTPARAPDKDYRIDIKLPPETIRHSETDAVEDLCGSILQPAKPSAQQVSYRSNTFSIEGHLVHPFRNLTGGCDKFVKSEDVASSDTQNNVFECLRFAHVGNHDPPWLMQNEAATSYHDGTSIPFRVTTSWNLKYHP